MTGDRPTPDQLRARADNIGLAGAIVGAMGMALPWWAWRRRHALQAEAEKMVACALDIKAGLP